MVECDNKNLEELIAYEIVLTAYYQYKITFNLRTIKVSKTYSE